MSLVDVPERPADAARVHRFMLLVGAGLACIVARLWYLQIAIGQDLLEQSEVNRTRTIRRVAPRGKIVDRRGEVVATNRRQIVVSVVPDEVRRNPGVLPRLAALLGWDASELEAYVRQETITLYDPVRVETDLPIELATLLEEQRLTLPGVVVGPEPIRHYPHGALLGHALGQMGEIPPDELRARRKEGYRPGDFCGKLGLERAYDPELRGEDGGREVEVDARGRMRREIGSTDPVPGDTVQLAVDLRVQKAAYEALAVQAGKGHPGAAVALDPRTGAVLALVSVPSYDPNQFVTGISHANWRRIQDHPLRPQINRAVSSAYAPGSTFKLVTALAGLESGTIGLSDGVYCTGVMRLGRWPKRCHKRGGHGYVGFHRALAVSCDIYFYRLARRLGPDRLARCARRFGLGRRTGIDLVRAGDPIQLERDGVVPDPAWKRATGRGEWVVGETVDYGIGQAMLACTPLQMCSLVAAIANGGTLHRPQLVQSITTYNAQNRPREVRRLQPEATGRLGFSPRHLREVVRGMEMVMQPGGTAWRSALPGVSMAGKTGTAQMRRRGRMVDNAWFVGFAPVEDPRIAVCVFVEEGGHGGEVAAPIARRMIAAYLGLRLSDSGATRGGD